MSMMCVYPKIAAKTIGLRWSQRERMVVHQLAADGTAAVAAVCIDGGRWWIIRHQFGRRPEVLRYPDGFCLERGPAAIITRSDSFGRPYQTTVFTDWADELHRRPRPPYYE